METKRGGTRMPRSRSDLMERVELETRLAAALLREHLVLLVAPAGYGKSLALARQVQLLPEACAVAWLTADAELDVPRFLRALAEALEPHDIPWKMAPAALAGPFLRQHGIRSTAEELLHALEASGVEHGVIVIDDFHGVTDGSLLELLAWVVERLPDSWTLAIASQVDPPLPLARMRARRQLCEFRQDALSLSLEEIEALCSKRFGDAGAGSSRDVARQLHELTHGWLAGVLMSLDAGNPSPTGGWSAPSSQRHLFDFLASEVFDRLPAELREFLIACSVLSDLTPEHCAVVSGDARAAEKLDEIERRGLFVSVLQGTESTLRLSALARAYLTQRLQRDDPDRVAVLLQRAAACESHPTRKIGLLLRAGAALEAERFVGDAVSFMLVSGEHEQIARLVNMFPAERREQSGPLLYGRGLHAWTRHDLPGMTILMARAAAAYSASSRHDEAQRALGYQALAMMLSGEMHAGSRVWERIDSSTTDPEAEVLRLLFAYLYTGVTGPAEAPGEHLARLADLLVHRGTSALWYVCVCMYPLSFMIGRRGVRAPMEQLMHGARFAAGDDLVLLQAEARRLQAWALLWQGSLRAADEVNCEVQADDRWLGLPRDLQWRSWLFVATHAAMRGDSAAVRIAFLQSDVVAVARIEGARRPYLSVRGFCHAATGDWEEVRGLVDSCDARWPFWGAFASLLKARLWLHDGRTGEAVALLRTVLATAAQADRYGLEAMARVSLAMAELRAGASDAAWSVISPLIDQVGASGEIGGVLLCGNAALVELDRAAWGPAATQDGRKELARWARLSTESSVKHEPQGEPGMTGDTAQWALSVREMEVLGHIAEGASNKVVARRLSLSPHTVKRHVARILERLELSSRTEAAAWYHRHASAAARGSPSP